MASSNVLGVQDAYALINSIAAQALGTELTATNTSSFVTVGEAIMQTGLESTLNAIGYVLGRTIFSIRPYRAKLSTLERDPERYGMITRKITYLYNQAEETSDFNTQLNPAQLDDGESIDMYVINAPKTVQLCFPGAQSLQYHYTRFRDQLRLAFSNETEFIRFWEGVSVEFYNNLEFQKEQKARAVLINRIAGNAAMGIGIVDMTYEFNAAFNTSYTREQLLTNYAEDFWKFACARIKADSDRLTDRSLANHASLDGYMPIIRHTPKDRQRCIMYNPAFINAKAQVYSTLFNPKYLDIGEFEGVNYWQSSDDPTAINVTPSILNTTTGEANAALSNVEIPYVLGCLFDEEAVGVMPKFDYISVTPFNSRGGYFNTFVHWLFKMYTDYSENFICYVMGDVATAKLTALIGTGDIGTQFDPDVTDYTVNVANNVTSITLYPNYTETFFIKCYLNDTFRGSLANVNVSVGDNIFKIVVGAPGYKSTTYTVNYVRAAEAKDGGGDDPEEKVEEPETKSTKSTKSK